MSFIKDVWKEISFWISKGSWIPFISACKMFYSFHTKEELLKRIDLNLTIPTMFPKMDKLIGKYTTLSYIDTLNIDFVISQPNRLWDPVEISKLEGVTLDLVLKHNLPWDFNTLSGNDSITFSDVIEHSYLPWDWHKVFECKKIDRDIIMDIGEYILDLSKNKHLPFHVVLQNLHLKWNWIELTCNLNICNANNVINHLNLPWVWQIIYYNSFMFDIVDAYPTLNWNWQLLIHNFHFTYGILKKYQVQWDYNEVAKFVKLPSEVIFKYKDSITCWSELSSLNVKYDIVHKLSYKHWDWAKLSSNYKMLDSVTTFDISLPWDFENLSRTLPIISRLDIVIQNPNANWQWDTISRNIRYKSDVKLMVNNQHLPWQWHLIYIPYDIESVLKHSHLNWNWGKLSQILPLDFIFTHQYQWSWKHISSRSDITLDMLKKNNVPWFYNLLTCDYDADMIQYILDNPNLKWNWLYISTYVKSLDLVLQNLSLPWSLSYFRYNNNFHIYEVLSHPEIPYEWKEEIAYGIISDY